MSDPRAIVVMDQEARSQALRLTAWQPRQRAHGASRGRSATSDGDVAQRDLDMLVLRRLPRVTGTNDPGSAPWSPCVGGLESY